MMHLHTELQWNWLKKNKLNLLETNIKWNWRKFSKLIHFKENSIFRKKKWIDFENYNK